ncbi:hypothetical protein IM774_05100 [Erysipelotrichaceae bacterium RD49]|nr:hypothetical protein [Erysipelotrichaceae bacterium RD49]
MRPPDPAHEQCLWCSQKLSGCETLAELLQGPGLLCQECQKKLKPIQLTIDYESSRQVDPGNPKRNRQAVQTISALSEAELNPVCKRSSRSLFSCSGFSRKIFVLYENNQETERLLRRIIQYGDLEPARIFLDPFPSQKKILKRYPIKPVAMSYQAQVFQAFFSGIPLKNAFEIEHRTKQKVEYLAVSLSCLTSEQIDYLFADPFCQGIWMLVQDPDWIAIHAAKPKLRWPWPKEKDAKEPLFLSSPIKKCSLETRGVRFFRGQ